MLLLKKRVPGFPALFGDHERQEETAGVEGPVFVQSWQLQLHAQRELPDHRQTHYKQ